MKHLRFLLVLLQWFTSIVQKELEVTDTWNLGFPPVKKFLESNFASQQLAKYFNGRGSYKGIRVILFKTKRIKSRYGKMIFLMAIPTPENVITGYIGKINVEDRNTRGKQIIDACAITTVPTILPANIVIYRAHLLNFNNATTKSAKNAAWKIVYADLKILLFTFQIAANADQPNSITILESGSFKIKGIGKKQRQVFSLANGVDSGTMDLTGNLPLKGKCLHDWWISVDLGKTYVRMDPTLESVTQATDLTVGDLIYFQHQYITPKGKDNGPLETLFKTVQ